MKEEMLFEIVKKEFDAKLTIRNGCINADDWSNNVEWHGSVDKPSWDAMLTLKNQYDAEHNRLEYARKRKSEYPTIEECVHAILDGELDALQVKRQAVKDKYPKGAN